MAGSADITAAKLQQALACHQQGQVLQAERLYREVLREQPGNAAALHYLGVVALQQGQAQVAAELIGKAIALEPDNSAACANLGLALQSLQRYAEALAICDRALALQPDFAEALNNRGNALQRLKRHDEALASYDRALAARPDYIEALGNRVTALCDLERYAEALASCDRALALRPEHPEGLNNRGNVLRYLWRYDEALASYDRALALRPAYPEALRNRGAVLCDLQRYGEALASCERALGLEPDSAEGLNNRSIALQGLGRLPEALASYDRALALGPGDAGVLRNRGIVLVQLGRHEEAVASYASALALRPDYPLLLGLWLGTKLKVCDWRDLTAAFERQAAAIDAGRKADAPFSALATPLTAAQQRRCAEIYVREKFPPRTAAYPHRHGPAHDRIRLGYFSADFHNHPVAYQMAGLFELHDREEFEVTAFAFGPPASDPMRARLTAALDEFIDVGMLSDTDIVRLARTREVDIAIDLMGFTRDSRTEIFALRAAPVQVNFLGYPGTMGAEYIDYLIADRTVIPEEHVGYYAEKPAYLPDTYWPTDLRLGIAGRQFTRAELGLPEQGFVFCCFNNNWKITPEVFDAWMRLLKQVEGSVLWLLEDNPAAGRNLRAEAQKRGIAAGRLVFAPRMDQPEHLARQRQADLFLDTLPYNAHNGASDALWAGLPVLTHVGVTFAGRVAASLLKAVGLPELITASASAYEALALELATDAGKLGALKQRLAANRLTQPLFDTPRFTRHLESAYAAMWQRQQAGLAPAHLRVPP